MNQNSKLFDGGSSTVMQCFITLSYLSKIAMQGLNTSRRAVYDLVETNLMSQCGDCHSNRQQCDDIINIVARWLEFDSVI